MLYIEDEDGSGWLSAVEVLGEREAYDMVLCLYPDSAPDAFPEPFASPTGPEPLERVTAYPDESEPPCSARLPVTGDLIDDLGEFLGDFEEWGDDLALYRPRETAWEAAYVPCRRMVLVRDVRLRDFLDAAGLRVLTEAPEGW